MTIIEFLEARIAEDEAAAAAYARFIGHKLNGQKPKSSPANPELRMPNPARLLAECAAKRKRLQVIEDGWISYNDDNILGELLALEAVPYADHADYRQDWAV
jgi:hypothetical protein